MCEVVCSENDCQKTTKLKDYTLHSRIVIPGEPNKSTCCTPKQDEEGEGEKKKQSEIL